MLTWAERITALWVLHQKELKGLFEIILVLYSPSEKCQQMRRSVKIRVSKTRPVVLLASLCKNTEEVLKRPLRIQYIDVLF